VLAGFGLDPWDVLHQGLSRTFGLPIGAWAIIVSYLEEFRGPNTGIRSSGWKQALQAFTIYFDGRIPTP
jgi:hypothetical protein